MYKCTLFRMLIPRLLKAPTQGAAMASIYRISPFLALCFLELVLQVSGAAVPAIFVFGDSTVDVGNNNYLKNCSVKARANYPPYGVDFPNSTPTGRFSNGYNTADHLAKLLGFPMSPPPYLSLTTNASIANQMLQGVNFASGGSGLLDATGQNYGEVINASAQLQHFSSAVELLRTADGTNELAEHLARSLFFISIGSNDILAHSYSQSPGAGNDTEFLASLVDAYTSHLRTLYGLGARKFSVASAPRLGCCPSQRARSDGGGCLEALNDLSRRFHEMVDEMLQTLSRDMPGMQYSLGDAEAIVTFVSEKPELFDMGEVEVACCGSGMYGESGCDAAAPMCGNRDDHVFWDLFHPTQAMSGIAARFLYSGFQPYVYPMNVQELSAM